VALLIEYRALLIEYRALLLEYRDILRALSIGCTSSAGNGILIECIYIWGGYD